LRTLLIDNYDSFTYNLFHLLAELLGDAPTVLRNDEWNWDQIRGAGFERIVLSPGPGRPERAEDFGVCADVLRRAEVPVLGICLGHQGLAVLCGGQIVHAPEPVHGRTSAIFHTGDGLFAGLPQGFAAMRYHSLVVAEDLPPELERTAWTRDGLVMALRHRHRPLAGVQFHPESIGCEHGRALLANFLRPAPDSMAAAARPAPRAVRENRSRLHVRALPHFPDPEAVFAARFAGTPGTWWLDSSRAEPGLARYSYMGAATGAPVHNLTELEVRLASAPVATGAPFPFHGGFVGYFGYETGSAAFHFVDRFLAFDHQTRICYAAWLDGAASEDWERAMAKPVVPLPEPPTAPPVAGVFARSRVQYLQDIRACLEHIREGDSYQLCLTNSLGFPFEGDPFTQYRRLRRANPAPCSAWLQFPALAIACSSPERFLRLSPDGWIESRPIKGTRPRGATPAEDDAIRRELAASEKERAENLMIVDLLRNDLGRVCETGSIHAPALLEIESYATVHQLVSTIRGRLRPGLGALDAVRAALPGGSMTGAPKIRTVRLLAGLERAPRGVYSGALGFLSLDGAMDLNIIIRTAVFTPGHGSIGAGGGIVSLSDPEREWDEMVHKARAVAAPLGVIL
jgi:para-aminobenzoate synthetase